ncbi:hypothetical protein BH11VER1_BH11VER1_16520 [soil metagenome]
MPPIPCPFLPTIDHVYTAQEIHDLGKDRSEKFYHTALPYAQSLWLEGFPAKALLLINRSLSCRLPEVSLQTPYQPYHAVAWILHHRPAGLFIGNPRRHYQHLATRMVEPHKELRTWRAWACWHLAKCLLDEKEYPGDDKQIREELVIEPRRSDVAIALQRLSPHDDLPAWEAALKWAQEQMGRQAVPSVSHGSLSFVAATVADLPVVQQLAHEIWPQAYSNIISMEQIHCMLERMYDLNEMRQEIVVRKISYALIQRDGEPIGYMAWEQVPNDQSLCLHKFYLKPALQGLGIGARALQWLEEQARQFSGTRMRLRVNRKNHQAIRAYLRHGFVFEYEICSDFEQGFVMDDHVMGKPLV